MHSTNNCDDGYLGSGNLILKSIQKYGKENHIFEILEFTNSRQELIDLERKIVTLDLVNDRNSLNLREGGEGGNTWIGLSSEEKLLRIAKQTEWLKDKEKFEISLEKTKQIWENKSSLEKEEIAKKKRRAMQEKSNHGEQVKKGHSNRTLEQKIKSNKIISEKIIHSYSQRKENDEEWEMYIEDLRIRVAKNQGKPVIIDGVIYLCVKDASRKLNIPEGTLRNRITSKNWNNYNYVI